MDFDKRSGRKTRIGCLASRIGTTVSDVQRTELGCGIYWVDLSRLWLLYWNLLANPLAFSLIQTSLSYNVLANCWQLAINECLYLALFGLLGAVTLGRKRRENPTRGYLQNKPSTARTPPRPTNYLAGCDSGTSVTGVRAEDFRKKAGQVKNALLV